MRSKYFRLALTAPRSVLSIQRYRRTGQLSMGLVLADERLPGSEAAMGAAVVPEPESLALVWAG
jgi:hypothetical protein